MPNLEVLVRRSVSLFVVLVFLLLAVSPAFAVVLGDPVVLAFKGKEKAVGYEDFGVVEAFKDGDTLYYVVELDMFENAYTVNGFWMISLWQDKGAANPGWQGESVQVFNFAAAIDEVSSKPSIALVSFDPFNDTVEVGSIFLQGALAVTEVGKGAYLVPDGPGYAVVSAAMKLKLDSKATQAANALAETADQTALRLQAELTGKLGVNW